MHTEDYKSKAVANWLLFGVGMTIIQIALGGITRLTGSGLSITEWDVVTGALPPMNEALGKPYLQNIKPLLNFNYSTLILRLIISSLFFSGNGFTVYGQEP
jgi:hypothetical protein